MLQFAVAAALASFGVRRLDVASKYVQPPAAAEEAGPGMDKPARSELPRLDSRCTGPLLDAVNLPIYTVPGPALS